MSSQATAHQTAGKKPYRPPTLTNFGPLSKLTQNGTSGLNENNGKGFCGTTYTKSGGASC